MSNNIAKYNKGWKSGLPETPCGAGSTMGNTKAQREWIPDIVEKYDIKTLNDIGAGDLNWINETQFFTNIKYTGYDLVPRHTLVRQFDLLANIAPCADALMCLWVLNHLETKDAIIAMENLKNSGATYLIITNTPKWEQTYITELECLEIMDMPEYDAEIRLIKL